MCRKMLLIACVLVVASITSLNASYGYDSGTDQGACGAQYRTSRMHKPPCDLGRQSYCVTAGTSYPWHAVRRFVRENQGLMRRMYGDQRHISVLRAEFEEEDLNFSEFVPGRIPKEERFDNELYYSDEGERKKEILNTKFVYSVEPTVSIKLGVLKAPPYFKPTMQRTTPTSAAFTINTATETPDENTTETTIDAVGSTVSIGPTTGTTANEGTEAAFTDSTVTEAVKGELLFQDVAGEDEEEKPENEENQINYNLKGVNACPVKEEVVAPFWANNTRGELLALLNLYPYEQYVHWEKCTFEHRQMYCRTGCRCEQQYRLHRLLAYDPNNECRGIFSDWFRFPSCCVCKCYDVSMEFRVTSRSPRKKVEGVPEWFKKRRRPED